MCHVQFLPRTREFTLLSNSILAARHKAERGFRQAVQAQNGNAIMQGQQILLRLTHLDHAYRFADRSGCALVLDATDAIILNNLLAETVVSDSRVVVTVVQPGE